MRMKRDDRFHDLMEYACDCACGKKDWRSIDDYAWSRGCTVADLARAIELVKITGGTNRYATYSCVVDRKSMDEFVMVEDSTSDQRKFMFFMLCIVGMTADSLLLNEDVCGFICKNTDINVAVIDKLEIYPWMQALAMSTHEYVNGECMSIVNPHMFDAGDWHDDERAAVMLDQLLFDFNIAYYGALVDTYGLGGLIGRLSRSEYLEMLEADRRYRRVYGTK